MSKKPARIEIEDKTPQNVSEKLLADFFTPAKIELADMA